MIMGPHCPLFKGTPTSHLAWPSQCSPKSSSEVSAPSLSCTHHYPRRTRICSLLVRRQKISYLLASAKS